jgi:hypothetical protein
VRLEGRAAEALRRLLRRAAKAALATLDLTEMVREVIAAIDFPEILRESSGAASSQAARVVRTEGMNADEAGSRFVDRVRCRPHPPVARIRPAP